MTSRLSGPPHLARALVRLLLPEGVRDEIEGDLLEGYKGMTEEHGRLVAKAWYWGQVFSLRPWALRMALRENEKPNGFKTKRGKTMSGFSSGLFGGTGDFRYAFRSFLRSPLHAVMTVVILAVGIGAVTVMFSALNASVLRPLPFPEPDELVWVWKNSDNAQRNSLSYDDFGDYRAGVDAFEDLAAFYVFRPNVLVTGLQDAERVRSMPVTTGFFRTLGVAPALGRSFLEEEAVEGGPRVVVLSYQYWQGRMGADPAVIGQTITIDGEPTEIVGVMPEGFRFQTETPLYTPARAGAGYTIGRGNNNFFIVGRLKDGVSTERAQSQMDVVGFQIQEANPDFAQWSHSLESLHAVFFGNMRTTLLILMGIVSLVPLVACANVASLTLARASARSTELATRFALGAGRGRVIRQLLVENLILASMGGLVGLGIASVGGRLLRAFGPASLPRLNEIGVDSTVVTFAMATSLLLVPLFGVLPALRVTGFNLAEVLRFGGGRGGSEGRGRVRRLLVGAQVAFSMMLLVTSGLFLKSFLVTQNTDPGFETSSILTAGIQIPASESEAPEELAQAWDETLARLEAIPGVVDVAVADWLPVVSGGGPWNGLSRPGLPLPDDQAYIPATRKFVSNDYFSTLGMTLKAGRPFNTDDRVGTADVIILSEPLADILFPDENPLGQPVTFWDRPFEVVGVSADVNEAGLGTALARPAFFIANGQYPMNSLRLMVRVAGSDPASITGTLRTALKERDPDIALSQVQTMEAGISGTLAQPRFQMALVGTFALVGLLLAAFGLYGVLAYLVAQRQHEIGIRMAIGAKGGDVLGLVLRQGMKMVLAGVVIGLIGGGGVSLFLQGTLFGVSPADPLTMGASAAVLTLVALVASLIPAGKAVRTDPLKALRAE